MIGFTRLPDTLALALTLRFASMACVLIGSSCSQLPPIISSSVLPSRKEVDAGKEYVGKTYRTNEDAYIYVGPFPSLSKSEPGVEKVVPVPSGSRFVVRRVELAQGRAGDLAITTVAGVFGGGITDFPDRTNVLYVDITLDSGLHRNIQLRFSGPRPGPLFSLEVPNRLPADRPAIKDLDDAIRQSPGSAPP